MYVCMYVCLCMYVSRYDNLDAVQLIIDSYEDGSGAHPNLPQNEDGDDEEEEVYHTYIHTFKYVLNTYIYIHIYTHIHTKPFTYT